MGKTSVVELNDPSVDEVHRPVDLSSKELQVNPHSDEELWELAMQEVDSTHRRQGLWAKCFGEAQGVEPAAKAAYMATRVDEMKKQLRLEQEQRVAKQKAEELEKRIANLDEAQKAYERLPKGTCPNCDDTIPLASAECPKCRAYFGSGSAWGVKPLE